ncbi:flagellar assembly peptidoglycan hydrolase FlgJ [Colwellia sp. MB02u-18]|uniref:flagellar assembly peptidoglycan hydrolase FlgJ n=1 Tax=unclassified Colwellia TaxID=196834 RepID=UPI0015F52DD3|nr:MULTISPECIES: flagellar assembly peptidoglycan hydrolase FlgJ [unclassified Colwellia]MBA6223196.1 flagellar assembly peptidoglycan hydrolase FlgJ [Colwellia sp. MB3u-45]MBA6265944.1 flagellar assembly peptidoglycan hydrolase FlgJ [Colwellia sp. MB3u-43]MBA6320253.1 flagellar assembly peptidoglycan hydrolase FlgJ [Colwellia sp. MB02u-19]MBA6323013.1 flagellar assembly peptidoglycan hydrolase FlgJ [Colwellia sp. MB02u-18]MBA6329700.1 flagellar assembly peptidoglycan hydrolase FlgJ [Colwellia
MTTRIADAQNFLDVNGLNSIRQDAKSGDKAGKKDALDQAAKQFEAIFMQMLMKSMRKAQEVLESDSPFNSESTKFYRDMHDQQMSLELSNNGALGLSELIVRQLGGDSENFTPHNILRSDGNLDSRGSLRISEPALLSNISTVNDSSAHQDPSKDRQTNGSIAAQAASMMQSPTFEQPKDFVSALTADAKRVQDKINVPFEVVIAQAALETGWGQKIIKTNSGESSNNLFNIKADSRWAGEKTHKETLEFENGAMVKKREPFRVYESIGQSVDDYLNLLTKSERYQGALENSANVEQFLHNLQSAGYATDPDYAKKIIGTLRTVTSLLDK